MKREYRRWFSPSLGRDMEVLVFGHAGYPTVVFPTSCGRFFEFEDRHMVSAVQDKLEGGHLQLFCVDSVDGESWYNRDVPPRWRIARQVQYGNYITTEVVPLIRQLSQYSGIGAIGTSFGGYHAMNMALRHPDIFTGMLSMSGAFDPSNFLRGYYDEMIATLISPSTTCPIPSTPGISTATVATPMFLQPASTTSAGTRTNAWPRSSAPKAYLAVSKYGATTQATIGRGGRECCRPISSHSRAFTSTTLWRDQ